jgi:replicative DNA helicase
MFEINQLPPQNINAEEGLLCSLLIGSDDIDEIIDILSPDDFYRTAHNKIFLSIQKLHERKEPIDIITVSNELKNRSDIEDIGGVVYLSKLTDTPQAVNDIHYANIIKIKSTSRKGIEVCVKTVEKLYKDSEPIGDILTETQRKISEIDETVNRKDSVLVKDSLVTTIERLESIQNTPNGITGVPSGIEGLDKLTCGFQKTDLIVMGGRPSMGKSTLGLNIGNNASIRGIPTAFFSLEMNKNQLNHKLLAEKTRINTRKFMSGRLSVDDWKNITEASVRLSEQPLFINDNARMSCEEISRESRRLKKKYNIGLVIIDYLGFIRKSRGHTTNDEVGEIMAKLKAMAKDLDLPVIILSQLNRELETRPNKRAKLADLRDSGNIEQDADIVMFPYRDVHYSKTTIDGQMYSSGKKPIGNINSVEDRQKIREYERMAEINIAKNRNGPVGTIPIQFDKSYSVFY